MEQALKAEISGSRLSRSGINLHGSVGLFPGYHMLNVILIDFSQKKSIVRKWAFSKFKKIVKNSKKLRNVNVI